MIKKIKLSFLSLFVTVCSIQAQNFPYPSPNAEVKQRIGLTDITVIYSRPGVKDRTIFGGLEAYGEVWRTGANDATKIEFSTDVNFAGIDIKTGSYSILTIPRESEWKVMINNDPKASEESYKAENNVAEITVKSMENEMIETMSFSFVNVRKDEAQLLFEWEKVKWVIPIKVPVVEQVKASIKEEMDKIKDVYSVYDASAYYYIENDLDLDQALEWSKKSVSISAEFWNLFTLSLAYHAKGDIKKAILTAERSLELSKEANYQPYIDSNIENIEKWKKEVNKKPTDS